MGPYVDICIVLKRKLLFAAIDADVGASHHGDVVIEAALQVTTAAPS